MDPTWFWAWLAQFGSFRHPDTRLRHHTLRLSSQAANMEQGLWHGSKSYRIAVRCFSRLALVNQPETTDRCVATEGMAVAQAYSRAQRMAERPAL